MFDIGFSELILIGLLALIVLGPKRLPEAARAAGRWMARLRRFIADVKRDFDRELHGEELAELRRLKEELDETRRLIGESSSEILRGLNAQITEFSESASHAADPTAASTRSATTPVPSDRTATAPPPAAAERPMPARRAVRSKTAKRKKPHGRRTRAREDRSRR